MQTRNTILALGLLALTATVGCNASPSDHEESSPLSSSALSTTPSKRGTLALSQDLYVGSVPAFYSVHADAVFSTTAGALRAGCTSVPVGASCSLTTCAGTVQPASTVSDDAGGITIASASSAQSGSFTFSPETSSYSYFGFQNPAFPGTRFFVPGETINFNAKGGGAVPAFHASIVAPAAATLTAPVVTDAGCALPPLGSDFDVSWSGGVAGDTMQLMFVGGDASELSCSFDAGAGTGKVPSKGGLDHIFSSNPNDAAAFSGTTLRTQSVDAGDYRIDVTVQSQGLGCYFHSN